MADSELEKLIDELRQEERLLDYYLKEEQNEKDPKRKERIKKNIQYAREAIKDLRRKIADLRAGKGDKDKRKHRR